MSDREQKVVIIPPDLLFDRFERLKMLRRKQLEIAAEIRSLAGDEAFKHRRQVECLRCGHVWTPYDPFVVPMQCSRCGTTAWNKPPSGRSRRPSDPPAKSWPKKSSRRKQAKLRAYMQEKDVLDLKERFPAPPPPSERPRVIVEARESAPMGIVPPPSISSKLPPPPGIGPSTSLSAYLAKSIEALDAPQPEVVTSHATQTEEPMNDEQVIKVEPPTGNRASDLGDAPAPAPKAHDEGVLEVAPASTGIVAEEFAQALEEVRAKLPSPPYHVVELSDGGYMVENGPTPRSAPLPTTEVKKEEAWPIPSNED